MKIEELKTFNEVHDKKLQGNMVLSNKTINNLEKRIIEGENNNMSNDNEENNNMSNDNDNMSNDNISNDNDNDDMSNDNMSSDKNNMSIENYNMSNEGNNNMSNEENEENNVNTEQLKKINNLQKKINKNKKEKLLLTVEDIHKENIDKNDSDYAKTPKCLINKKIRINPQTKDNISFMDAITLSLYFKTIGKNNTRSSKIRKYSGTINWKNINFPLTGQDYKQ